MGHAATSQVESNVFWCVQEFLELLDSGKERFYQLHGSFLCFAFLATAPHAQGRGLGSQLMSHVLSHADAAGKWAYLEASNENNARLYARCVLVITVPVHVWGACQS